MLGEGNGRFGAAQSFNNGSGAAVLGVAVGDVTSDGVPDVVSNAFATLSVSAGVGDGTFGPPVLSGAGGGDQPATLLADVTGDGITDAVSVIRTGTPDNARTTLIVNTGSGEGTFSAGQEIDVDTTTRAAEVADLGSDGSPDVFLVGYPGRHTGRGGLFVLRTVGGQLGPATYYGGPSMGLAVADLNADARPDVATIGSTALELFTSKVGGALVGAGTLPAGPDAVGVAAAALDGPGRVDLIELDSGNPEQLVHYKDATP